MWQEALSKIDSRTLAAVLARAALVVVLGAQAVDLLWTHLGAPAGTEVMVWIPAASHAWVRWPAGLLLGGLAVALAVGRSAGRAGIATILVVDLALLGTLVGDRLVRSTVHFAPYLALGLAVAVLSPKRPGEREDQRYAWACLGLRLFIGFVFVVQGWHGVTHGLVDFARRVYVEPFAGTLPGPLLWLAGLSNPPIMLASGLGLVLGWATRWSAAGAAAFLISILLGHMLVHPFDVDPSFYALPNLLVALLVLVLAPRGNALAVDSWRRGSPAR